MTNPDERHEESALAAEYALRLLEGNELRMAEARAAADPEFARQVAAWQEDLAPLSDATAPVKPRRRVKTGVQTTLFGAAEGSGLWSAVGIWRGLALASMTATAALAVLLMTTPRSGVGPGGPVTDPATGPGTGQIAQAPLYIGEIASEDGSLRLLAAYDSASATVQFRRVAGAPRPGRALELWAITDGKAPVSLGLIDGAEGQRVPLPDAVVAQLSPGPTEGAAPSAARLILAISDEPPGGSPTGQPTGDVLAAGPVTTL